MAQISKLKTFVSKTKGLERFIWIKNRAIMRQVFKYWKALIPQEKGLSFWIKWIKGAIIGKNWQWKVDKSWQI